MKMYYRFRSHSEEITEKLSYYLTINGLSFTKSRYGFTVFDVKCTPTQYHRINNFMKGTKI